MLAVRRSDHPAGCTKVAPRGVDRGVSVVTNSGADAVVGCAKAHAVAARTMGSRCVWNRIGNAPFMEQNLPQLRPVSIRIIAVRGYVMEPDQIDILAFAVFCDFEEVDNAEETGLACEHRSDVG
jgi:hypothetical protein